MSAAHEAPVLLSVWQVSKTYRGDMDLLVLYDVSINVREGECVGLVGPSGSGKSTLANVIAGLVEPDSGEVHFNGASFGGQPGRMKRAARKEVKLAWLDMKMIFQNPEASFLPSMRLGDAIYEGVRYLQIKRSADKHALVKSALDAVGLPASYADRYPFELSGGECQRAAIARAIIGKPRLVICDEPTSSLDVTIQAVVMELLGDIHKRLGTAFLFISHDMALVNEFCSRIYRIEDGRIVEQLEVCG